MKNRALGYFIGYSVNPEDRYKASSGGVGISIVRYLLTNKIYGTALSFVFDKELCEYVPKLIYSFDDINNCGSVYQDINIYKFLKKELSSIKNGIVVSCPPCQVSSVKNLLSKNGINCFIISFSCSGQITKEGTWKYYELLGVNRRSVKNLQYRGNGWPSGIQILLKDGTSIFKSNYTEPWITLKQSNLYTPKRCAFCTLEAGLGADISLADPWLKRFLENDKIGHTLFIPISQLGLMTVEKMKGSYIIFESASYDDYYNAQLPNVNKSKRVLSDIRFIRRSQFLMSKFWYFKWASKNLKSMKFHIKLLHIIKRFS